MTDELLPCPFCGAAVKHTVYPTLAYIVCEKCGCKKHSWGPESEKGGERLNGKDGIYWCDVLDNLWNTRAEDPRLKVAKEALGSIAFAPYIAARKDAASDMISIARAALKQDEDFEDDRMAKQFYETIEDIKTNYVIVPRNLSEYMCEKISENIGHDEYGNFLSDEEVKDWWRTFLNTVEVIEKEANQ